MKNINELMHEHKSSIENCLRVAAERFTDNATELRRITENQGFMTVNGAQRLADQFDKQAAEANEIAMQLITMEWCEHCATFTNTDINDNCIQCGE